ncbi:MAG: NUDIX domain-containing protein [Anaerolineales bacterium]|nr:NUDIX domain-containing protein [Anaerolineales bacterium]MCB9127295.1 NUDIX domain-containing protein [Ardenticatenales bacterium]MCB9172584.1 NUDIX domain-containing protein [Ardenticatenales bacterium]
MRLFIHRLLLALLEPLWRRAPLGLRRWLIWRRVDHFVVGVASLCLNERNELLLLEHRFHSEYPWGFPGGWTDRGETPIHAAVREIREETGLEATVDDLLAVTGDGAWVEIYFLCRVPTVEPTIQRSEMRSYRWVDPLDCDVRLTPNQMRMLRVLQARLRGEPSPIFPVAGAALQPLERERGRGG